MHCRVFTWMWMLSKRLYKKPAFIMLFLLIPLLILGYASVDKQDSGVISIALACEDNQDPAAAEAMAGLQKNSRLIRFLPCDSPGQAMQAVAKGDVHAAWIFRDHMQQRIERFVTSRSREDAFIRVIQREESVMLRVAREKLSGAAYSASTEAFSLSYIRKYIPSLNSVTDEQLISAFREITMDTPLFEFETASGAAPVQTGDFLDSPLRGLLGVVAVMAALASEVYYVQDEKKGLFAWTPQHRRPWVELGYQLVLLLNMGVILMVSLWFSGNHGSFARELAVLAVFSLTALAFSFFARMLCRNAAVLTAALPVVMIVMIAVCPIFYDLPFLKHLQLLLPPTYWIKGLNSDRYLKCGLLYGVGLLAVCLMLRLLFSGKRSSVSDGELADR